MNQEEKKRKMSTAKEAEANYRAALKLQHYNRARGAGIRPGGAPVLHGEWYCSCDDGRNRLIFRRDKWICRNCGWESKSRPPGSHRLEPKPIEKPIKAKEDSPKPQSTANGRRQPWQNIGLQRAEIAGLIHPSKKGPRKKRKGKRGRP